LMARPRVQPPRYFPRLSVNVDLRHEFAAPLTMTIEPGDWLFAAHPVEDIIGEHFRNRAWITISENADTDATIWQHRHQRAPADPSRRRGSRRARRDSCASRSQDHNANRRTRRIRMPRHARVVSEVAVSRRARAAVAPRTRPCRDEGEASSRSLQLKC